MSSIYVNCTLCKIYIYDCIESRVILSDREKVAEFIHDSVKTCEYILDLKIPELFEYLNDQPGNEVYDILRYSPQIFEYMPVCTKACRAKYLSILTHLFVSLYSVHEEHSNRLPLST
jgi:hypothetical protein